jgi:hypothetical protein
MRFAPRRNGGCQLKDGTGSTGLGFYTHPHAAPIWLRKSIPFLGRFRGQAAVGWRSESFAMHDENDPKIEYSPLCEEVTRDGLTVRVQIYRLKPGNDGWSLEVIDHENVSTVWDDLFATDHEALAEFSRTLDDEGIQSFLVDRARLN